MNCSHRYVKADLWSVNEPGSFRVPARCVECKERVPGLEFPVQASKVEGEALWVVTGAPEVVQ